METAAKILTTIVAIEHLYFMYFEMFAWETIGKRTFRLLPAHLFQPTKVLAANQGLYNGSHAFEVQIVTGKVSEEFGYYSIEVTSMQKAAIIPDTRFSDLRTTSKFRSLKSVEEGVSKRSEEKKKEVVMGGVGKTTPPQDCFSVFYTHEAQRKQNHFFRQHDIVMTNYSNN
ncbi:MAG: DUF1304 domain-containing protein [Cryomorphaceae bacterium]|nr:MAG: DUF1304 domain-containing protein [Cryomorphaceae bacterium]